jgi:hypothetical protein
MVTLGLGRDRRRLPSPGPHVESSGRDQGAASRCGRPSAVRDRERCSSHLEHRNLVRLLDAGQSGRVPYLIAAQGRRSVNRSCPSEKPRWASCVPPCPFRSEPPTARTSSKTSAESGSLVRATALVSAVADEPHPPPGPLRLARLYRAVVVSPSRRHDDMPRRMRCCSSCRAASDLG